jgi:hypothetical protein
LPRRIVEKQRIVRLSPAPGESEFGLNGVLEAQGAQAGTDEPLLRLRLVGRLQPNSFTLPELDEALSQVANLQIGEPIHPGQPIGEEVRWKEPAILCRADRDSELVVSHLTA